MAQKPLVGQGLLTIEASRSHTHTHHTRYDASGRVISPKHRPLPDNTQHSQQINIRASGGIRTGNPRKLVAADPRLRPRDHRNRPLHVNWYKVLYPTGVPPLSVFSTPNVVFALSIHSCFASGRSWLHTSARRPAILSEVSHDFPQSHYYRELVHGRFLPQPFKLIP